MVAVQPDSGVSHCIDDSQYSTEFILKKLQSRGIQLSPSDEQIQIIRSALSGKSIKVQAFAGTGKTTTIRMLTSCLDKPGLYVAFNKSIVTEVGNSLNNTEARTAHSLAHSATIKTDPGFARKLKDKSKIWSSKMLNSVFENQLSPFDVKVVKSVVRKFAKSTSKSIDCAHIEPQLALQIRAHYLSTHERIVRCLLLLAELCLPLSKDGYLTKINDLFEVFRNKGEEQQALVELILREFSISELVSLVEQTLKNFKNYSPNKSVSLEDFPQKFYQRVQALTADQVQDSSDEQIQRLLQLAKHVWSAIIDPNHHYPMNEDCYLKLWQLSDPVLDTQIIYIDEAQDLDPVMLDILQKQTCQKVWFGDQYQQIYEWRGAVNALNLISVDTELYLTETYRFPLQIADLANKVLTRLKSPAFIKSKINNSGQPLSKFAFIARNNKTLFNKALEMASKNKKFSWAKFDVSTIENYCKAIIAISSGRPSPLHVFEDFSSIQEIEEHLEDNPDEFIRRALDLCKEYSFNLAAIQATLQKIKEFNDPNSPNILTTAHQSKGLEWDYVLLANDFCKSPSTNAKEEAELAEWNLLYVALTRAKLRVQMFGRAIGMLFDGLDNILDASPFNSTTERDDSPRTFIRPDLDLFFDEGAKQAYQRFLSAQLPLPVIGHDVVVEDRVVASFEFAWPHAKVGVFLEGEDMSARGWRSFSMAEIDRVIDLIKVETLVA